MASRTLASAGGEHGEEKGASRGLGPTVSTGLDRAEKGQVESKGRGRREAARQQPAQGHCSREEMM